jgi:ribosomal protein L11 methyltransferase
MIKKPLFLYELCCTLSEDNRGQTEILRNFLVGYGVKAQDIVSFERGGRSRLCIYFDRHEKAKILQRKINQRLDPSVRFKIRKIKNENWKTKFAKNFSIFALTKRFDVVPAWHLKKYRKTRRTPIILESINAFGTGLHETTSFMAYFIERCQGQFNTFFDIGTGTGLLSFIALKCGAKEILAIDIDEDAVVAAKKNFKINGYDPANARKADIETYPIRKRFDFVAANLITRDLLKYKKKIIAAVAPKGFLAISGILEENYPEIRKAFKIKKLRCVEIKKGTQWVALLYKRAF